VHGWAVPLSSRSKVACEPSRTGPRPVYPRHRPATARLAADARGGQTRIVVRGTPIRRSGDGYPAFLRAPTTWRMPVKVHSPWANSGRLNDWAS